MTVVYKNHLNNKKEAYLKGAPDLILKQCTKIIENGRTRTLTKEDRIKILEKNNQFANDALRVLGMAYREVDHDKYTIKNTEVERFPQLK